MRLTLTILTLILTILNSTLSAQTNNDDNINGYWSYCDGYTFKYLALKNDKSFDWYYSSCKGDHSLTGEYIQVGDTLLLTDITQEKEIKVLRRNDYLYSYAGQDGQFPDFEPFTKTTKNSQKKASKECRQHRKDVRRKTMRLVNSEVRKEMKSEK